MSSIRLYSVHHRGVWYQSDHFLFPSGMHSGLAQFMIFSCILNTYACVCGCVFFLNELQHFTELADFTLYQHFPVWDKTGLSIISQIPSLLKKKCEWGTTNQPMQNWQDAVVTDKPSLSTSVTGATLPARSASGFVACNCSSVWSAWDPSKSKAFVSQSLVAP